MNRNLFDTILGPPVIASRPANPQSWRHSCKLPMKPSVPDHVLRERDARYELNDERDLTAVLMGDPLRQPHSLGACAVSEPVWITCNTASEL